MRTIALAVAATAVAATTAIDWRDSGCVGPVQNQGQLGRSELFPTVESVECVASKQAGRAVKLSLQQVIDCSDNSGLFGSAFAYVEKYGLESESSYPPARTTEKCHYNKNDVVVEVTKVGGAVNGTLTEKDMEEALNTAPLVAAFNVGMPFQVYTSGVIKDCGVGGGHVMEVVGTGSAVNEETKEAEDYWIVKNSWGESWGLKGYALIAKDIGACGLKDAEFLIPEKVSVKRS